MVTDNASACPEQSRTYRQHMIDTLAHRPDPYPCYRRLRERGAHQLPDGRWVVATAADVTAVLNDPGAIVGFAPTDHPLAALQARMARFSDGADHAERRASCRRHLRRIDPADLRRAARALTRERIAGAARSDVMAAVARHVPVALLAAALGVADTDAAVQATRRLCLALAPPLDAGPIATGDAEHRLPALLDHTADGTDDHVVNAVALLFQAMDATAGLIGNTLLAAHRHAGGTEDLVSETARHDAPVHLTTRLAAAPLRVGGRTIPAGDRVVVLLAAASRDGRRYPRPDRFVAGRGARSFTFGAGPRACPGADHARALAAGVLDALPPARTRIDERTVTFERRANLRIPRTLTVHANEGSL
jgi:cytochrome P450